MPLFTGVTLTSLGLAWAGVPVAPASLLHHNFNEAYMRDIFKTRTTSARSLRMSCVILNMFLFAAILRHSRTFVGLNEGFLFLGVIASAVWYFSLLLFRRRDFSLKELIDSTIYEIVSFAVLALSFVYDVRLAHLFLYHFAYWALYPIPRLLKKGPTALSIYTMLHVATLAGFAILFSCFRFNPSVDTLVQAFGFIGMVHIGVSFGLSKEQPSWIVKLFQTTEKASAPVAPRSPIPV
jgi:hypothetical protein